MSKEFDLDELEKLLKELVDKALEQYDAGYAVDLEGEYKQVSKRLLKAHTAALDEAYKQGYIAAGVEALAKNASNNEDVSSGCVCSTNTSIAEQLRGEFLRHLMALEKRVSALEALSNQSDDGQSVAQPKDKE